MHQKRFTNHIFPDTRHCRGGISAPLYCFQLLGTFTSKPSRAACSLSARQGAGYRHRNCNNCHVSSRCINRFSFNGRRVPRACASRRACRAGESQKPRQLAAGCFPGSFTGSPGSKCAGSGKLPGEREDETCPGCAGRRCARCHHRAPAGMGTGAARQCSAHHEE